MSTAGLISVALVTISVLAAGREQARRDWFWKGRRTPGANPFLLRQKAIEQMKAMRAKYSTSGLHLLTQPWQPVLSATTNFYGIRSAGATVGMAVDPTNSETVYTASAGGGVWKTIDAGNSWTPLTDQEAFTENGSFTVDPNNSNVLYVGAAGGFLGVTYAGGILKSSDAGNTWTLMTGPFVGPFGANDYFGGSDYISAIAVQPSNSNVILVGTSGGHSFAMYRTSDGGKTWTTVIDNSAAISDIHFNPNDSNTVYAAVCGGYTPVNEGIYKSTDGGSTWRRLSSGLPSPSQLNGTACRFAISPSNSSVLAVLFNGSNGQLPTVFTTSDAGEKWVQVGSPPDNPHGAGIFFSPTNSNIIFDGSADFYRSMDGGATWQSILDGIHPDQGGFAWVGSTNQLYIGNDGGVFYTPDATVAAVHWTNLNNGLATLRLYPGMSLHPTDANIILAGTQDEGTILSNDASEWNTVTCGDSAFTAIDRINPSNIYANCYYAQIEKSTDGGASFRLAIEGINTGDPMQFFPPLVMDPSDGSRLYFGTDHVYQTTNGAQTWTPISPVFNILSRIAVSPKDPNIVYAADAQQVWTTTNALSGTSATWSGSNNGLPPREVLGIAGSLSDSQTAYATVSGFSGFVDQLGHVFKTSDGGHTWKDISGDLPNIPVDDIVIDPDLFATLYIATDVGMFTTRDGGAHWMPLGSGLPNTVVTNARLFEPTRDLFVSTFGRGVWDLKLPPPGAAPTFTVAGVTNAASFASGPISPGAIVTVFGINLSTVQGILQANAVPLPTWLANTSVSVNGILAPLFALANVNGQEQINLQVPFEIAGQSAVPIVVNNNGVSSLPVQVPVLSAQPGIFTTDGTNAAARHGANNSLITPSSPSAKGETVVIYATGLGPVSSSPGTGNPASTITLSNTQFSPSVTFGGVDAHVAFSGLAPTFVGLYQINAVVPSTAASGSVDLVVTVNGVGSKPAKIAIQ